MSTIGKSANYRARLSLFTRFVLLRTVLVSRIHDVLAFRRTHNEIDSPDVPNADIPGE
jgi:hypothetical protein